MGNAERTEPLTIIGPKGLARVVGALRTIAPELPFEIECVEMSGQDEYFEINGYHIHAFRVRHNVTCYGYSVEIKRAGRFSVERAKEQAVPIKLWSHLQKGETIEQDGITYTPQMVLGPQRKGLKVTYCTDSRPLDAIVEAAQASDLFICEGMYAEKEKLVKAKQYKHMTFYEAAEMAQRAGVEELWLTHFSPSLIRAEDYMPKVRKIFPNAHLGKDGKSVELIFTEE
jgi:ribonuclease Z